MTLRRPGSSTDEPPRSIWNGHVEIETEGNRTPSSGTSSPGCVRRLLLRPAHHLVGPDEFDAFPKGAGCFFAPRDLLGKAIDAQRSGYADERFANDDTVMIRRLAAAERINISPGFRCTYQPRQGLGRFARHAFHRGTVFLDGHGYRGPLFPVVAALIPSRSSGCSRIEKPLPRPCSRLQPRPPAGRPLRSDCGGRRTRRSWARSRRSTRSVTGSACGAAFSSCSGDPRRLRDNGRADQARAGAAQARRARRPYLLATTAQQVQQIPSFLEQFGLRQPDLWLARGSRDATCASIRTFQAGSPRWRGPGPPRDGVCGTCRWSSSTATR